jgi:nucleotide-binding universal stress UspA family protein
MQPIHVTLVGAILAFAFAASVGGVLYWMLHLPEQTPPTVARAVRYAAHANLVLVPVQGNALSDRMVALGCQMAKARQARIEVYYVIEVPTTLPLDATVPDLEDLAIQVVSRAQRIADRYGVRPETKIAHAREAGVAIVGEATLNGADIILMGDIPRRPGTTRFGTTTAYVFAHAPCEVMIDRPALEELRQVQARTA